MEYPSLLPKIESFLMKKAHSSPKQVCIKENSEEEKLMVMEVTKMSKLVYIIKDNGKMESWLMAKYKIKHSGLEENSKIRFPMDRVQFISKKQIQYTQAISKTENIIVRAQEPPIKLIYIDTKDNFLKEKSKVRAN